MGLFRRGPAPELDVDAIAAAVATKMAASTAFVPLPREDFGQGFPFSPGVPLLPYGIDPREPNQERPAPRRSEFVSSVNLQAGTTRLLPFQTLRDAAERIDVMRRCIEVRKAQMLALDWDIVLSRGALKTIMIAEKISSPGKASAIARQRLEPEMARLRAWWEKPDAFNGLNFAAWLALLLEEQLVVDAVAVWPRRQGNGDVVAFEILDGATIKPLLDHRGATPIPPNPAFQQVLYGFPRGEFVASDTGNVDGYLADQLVYRPRYRRTWTPYGSPPTEQALAAADIYLKRMAWIRGEFTDGTTPDTWLKIPAGSKDMTPANIRAYEAAINAELSGQVDERRHLRILPPGVEPSQMKNFGELFNPDLDEFLIKLLCACFDVMPTEMGFAPKGGIGGKGHQEGEANSAQRKAVRPTAEWIGGLLTDLSRQFLGMPPELEFSMLGYEIEDQNAQEVVTDSQVRRGGISLNEDRASRGLPMFDFPEADTPFLVTGSGVVFLPGAIAAQAAAQPAPGEPGQSGVPPIEPSGVGVATSAPPVSATDPRPADATPEAGDPIAADEPVPDGFVRVAGHLRSKPAAAAEVAKFAVFTRRRANRKWRDFEFTAIDPGTAARLNTAGQAGDTDLIKHIVADITKSKRTVGQAMKDQLVATHGPLIGAAVTALLPSSSDLVDGFTGSGVDDAQSYIDDVIDDGYDDVDQTISDFVTAGHLTAWQAAGLDDEPDPENPPSRLQALLDQIPDLRDIAIAALTGLVVSALISHDPPANTAAVVDTPTFADDFANVQLTATLTAGTLDSAETQQISRVQLVASAGDCEFCDGYDGRIMTIDDDSGMPPLHRGCNCDIDPLD